jgi:hypothetical protein
MVKSSKTGGKSQCSESGEAWKSCQGYMVGGGTPVSEISNATEWWYTKIYPHIPEDEKKYYTEPFGGALQPSGYIPQFRKLILNRTNEEQGILYDQLLGARYPGTRSAIHRHDFAATTHIMEGYATVFLEGAPPQTYGPGQTYYMPGGGKTMTSAIMPNPFYNGTLVQQAAYSRNLDNGVAPNGASSTTWLEIETNSDGEVIFNWTRRRTPCNETPRYSCYA